jgi:tetratricopeptide (TPR) repeat protein
MPSVEPDTSDASDPQPTLESVLDAYMDELAAGAAPDQVVYLERYPDLADALRGVFRTLDFVEATSRSLNASKLERDQRLGDYRIVREIGRGGMGVVYEAIQTSLNRRVALKVLASTAVFSDHASERFVREAATAGRLHHTNIVPVYAVGEEQGILYYAMQFIEGVTLAEYLAERTQRRAVTDADHVRRVARWGRAVAGALEHAHRHGVRHRDIKPSNLLLDATDNVWVTDFGLARADATVSLTVSGDVIGTARYMAPEQARGGRSEVDARADIYALGATLYELLAARPAYDGTSRDAVLSDIVFTAPTPLRSLAPAVPRDLETIIAKCMAKSPDDRYASASEVREDLRRFLSGESIVARRTPIIRRAWRYARRRRMRIAGLALVAVLLIAIVGLVIRFRGLQGQHKLDAAMSAIILEHKAERARGLLEEAERLGLDSARLHLCEGLIAIFDGQTMRALEPLQRALSRDPEDVEVLYAISLAYYSNGDVINGHRYFTRVGEDQTTTALGWLLRGWVLAELERDGAIECYNAALRIRPDYTPAIEARAHHRAFRLLVDGDRAMLEPMLDDYDAWVTFWPDSPRAYSARASGRMHAAAYAKTQPDLRELGAQWSEGALQDVRHAIEMMTRNQSIALGRLGSYQRYLGRFGESADSFRRAIELDPGSGDAPHAGYVHHLALALHAMGQTQQALDAVTPVAEAYPALFPPVLHRSLLLAEQGAPDAARQVARQCVDREQWGDGSAFILAVAVLDLVGDRDGARAAVDRFSSEDRASIRLISLDSAKSIRRWRTCAVISRPMVCLPRRVIIPVVDVSSTFSSRSERWPTAIGRRGTPPAGMSRHRRLHLHAVSIRARDEGPHR